MNLKKIITNLTIICIAVCMILPRTVYAQAHTEKIRVGFINGYGIAVGNGAYKGYAYDYLMKIAEHAGFTYEFFDGEWDDNVQRLVSGDIDLLCPVPESDVQFPELEFTRNNIGYDYLGLFASLSNENVYFDDFDAFSGMKVGMFRKRPAFSQYEQKNGFAADCVVYESVKDMRRAFEKGEIEAYVLESWAQYDDVKMIGKIDAFPAYVVAKAGNTALIDKIDSALLAIRSQDIFYTYDLYDKYLSHIIISAPAFSKDEKAYIASREIKIAFDPAVIGLESYDAKNKEFVGIIPDVLRLMAEKSGLNIVFVPTESYEQSVELLNRGEVSAITGYVYNIDNYPYAVTEPIVSAPLDTRLLLNRGGDSQLLLSVLNKANKRVSESEINTIIMKNTFISEIEITPLQIILKYGFHIFAGLMLLIAAILAFVLWMNRRARRRLYSMAYYDTLTKSPKIDRLRMDVEGIFTKGEQKGYSVLYFDIRSFKNLNELLGYKMGNNILVEVAELCRSELRPGDLYARLSADVFILFIKRGADEIRALIRRFDAALGTLPELSGYAISPIFEWGIYTITDNSENFEYCLDRANYARKLIKGSADKNICVYDNDLHAREGNVRRIEGAMRKALADGEFAVYLQPKVHMRTGELVGAEALVRWLSADGGVQWFPSDFINVFERNGFIAELDRYMLEQVCALQSKWMKEGVQPIPISVNQSKILLSKTGYAEDVLRTVNDYGIYKRFVEIEITETILHDNLSLLTGIMKKLQGEGLTFSVDDFGSGFSSLSLLGKIPSNTLKIDRAILLEAERSGKGCKVLKNIIALASDVDMKCVCEGVETKEQERLLLALGCEYAQGYFYGKPMPIQAFETLRSTLKVHA